MTATTATVCTVEKSNEKMVAVGSKLHKAITVPGDSKEGGSRETFPV